MVAVTIEDLTSEDIDQLRELIDALPLRTHAPLIYKVLRALPIFRPADLAPKATLAESLTHVLGTEMRITAHTEAGKAMLPTLIAHLTGTKQ